MKSTSFKEAMEIYETKYKKGRTNKSISLCDPLHTDYKVFVAKKRQSMSHRIRLLLIKDMEENPNSKD